MAQADIFYKWLVYIFKVFWLRTKTEARSEHLYTYKSGSNVWAVRVHKYFISDKCGRSSCTIERRLRAKNEKIGWKSFGWFFALILVLGARFRFRFNRKWPMSSGCAVCIFNSKSSWAGFLWLWSNVISFFFTFSVYLVLHLIAPPPQQIRFPRLNYFLLLGQAHNRQIQIYWNFCIKCECVRRTQHTNTNLCVCLWERWIICVSFKMEFPNRISWNF